MTSQERFQMNVDISNRLAYDEIAELSQKIADTGKRLSGIVLQSKKNLSNHKTRKPGNDISCCEVSVFLTIEAERKELLQKLSVLCKQATEAM